MVTVVAAVYSFSEEFPEARMYATGSTISGTRLHGMGINGYFDIAEEDFHIMAERNGVWDNNKKGNNYDAQGKRI